MLKLEYSSVTGECDVVIEDGELLEGDDLYTAALLSIFTDLRVDPEDVPEGVGQGGWWGDAYTNDPTDEEGSRLWLLPVRGRADLLTSREAEGHVLECLEWMIRDGVATTTSAAAAVVRTGVIGITIRIDDDVSFSVEVT